MDDMQNKQTLKPSQAKHLINIINAGLTGETKRIELAALSLSKSLKKDYPTLSAQINESISSYTIDSGAKIRSGGGPPLPVDHSTNLEMVTTFQPELENELRPFLPDSVEDRINLFFEERSRVNLLLENGLTPSSSLLLTGEPGTGKTMLAKYIASKLNKRLLVLDLSSSVSSLMGKTGANLKRVLSYAKSNPCVLLLDEFDAIAKKRDDSTDLGEIKRIVNVLLMELDNWPVMSPVVATSNHPELLDRAIWRRFDHHIAIPMPDKEIRYNYLQHLFEKQISEGRLTMGLVKLLSELMEGMSPANMKMYADRVARRSILRGEELSDSALIEFSGQIQNKKRRGQYCVVAKRILGESISVRQLAQLTGLSSSGVQHHLKKDEL